MFKQYDSNMKEGDVFTLGNCYKRRTFMQWVRNEPKQLQTFVVTATSGSLSYYEQTPPAE